MSNPVLQKGTLGCATGLFLIFTSLAFAIIVFLKCFGLAYQHNYDFPRYISAVFTREALHMYFLAGLIFFAGLSLAINGMIRILKDFFEV